MYESTKEAQYLNWANQSVTTLVNGYYGTKGNPLVIQDHFHSQDVFYRSLNEFYAMLRRKNIETSLQKKLAAFLKANADANLEKAKEGDWFTQAYLKKDKENAWTVNGMITSVMGAMISS